MAFRIKIYEIYEWDEDVGVWAFAKVYLPGERKGEGSIQILKEFVSDEEFFLGGRLHPYWGFGSVGDDGFWRYNYSETFFAKDLETARKILQGIIDDNLNRLKRIVEKFKKEK